MLTNQFLKLVTMFKKLNLFKSFKIIVEDHKFDCIKFMMQSLNAVTECTDAIFPMSEYFHHFLMNNNTFSNPAHRARINE